MSTASLSDPEPLVTVRSFPSPVTLYHFLQYLGLCPLPCMSSAWLRTRRESSRAVMQLGAAVTNFLCTQGRACSMRRLEKRSCFSVSAQALPTPMPQAEALEPSLRGPQLDKGDTGDCLSAAQGLLVDTVVTPR